MLLVPYDKSWPKEFAREAKRLRTTLGENVFGRIEHVGSTAVPGLAAKPIIDLNATVPDLDAARREMPRPLVALGYEHRPQDAVPERILFCLGPEDNRTHYLSLAEETSDFWRDKLSFRDFLRAHPATAAEYMDLKRELARRHPEDRAAYTAGKSGFVTAILAWARGV